jgi:hypothetical protein
VASLPPAFMLVSCLAYFSTLKMEATCFSEASVEFQRTTWRYIPEDRTLQEGIYSELSLLDCSSFLTSVLVLIICTKLIIRLSNFG